jgi:hypothetical protein
VLVYVPGRISVNTLEQLTHVLQTPVAAPPDDTQEKYASAQQPDAPQQGIFGFIWPFPGSMRDSLTPLPSVPWRPPGNNHDYISSYIWAARPKHLFVVAAPSANSRVAAIPYQPIAANAKFVTTVGTQFVLDGKLYYPGGTNWCGHVTPSSCTCVPDMFTIPKGRLERSSVRVAHHMLCVRA